ncbi:MAG: class I SAM-dependent methyltransferase [Akkermansiaceae bacterium]
MNRRATHLAHELIESVIEEGDTVIDATAGNGHDTLFLARLVGEAGCIHAIDIQQKALDATAARLAETPGTLMLHLCSHDRMTEHVGEAKAVMFNLGYLPGADHATITRKDSTLAALAAAITVLSSGGVLTCVCYPGHPGGLEEAEAVLAWAKGQAGPRYELITANEKDRLEGRPFLVALKKARRA